MAKKKNLTDRQKRVRRRRRRSTLSRVMFALEIIVLVVLMGGLFVYAKLGKLNHETINEEEIDVNESVTENQVMKGYTTIALVGIDSRDDKLKSDWNSDTMIIASINNDTKKVKLVSVYRDTYLCLGEDEDGNNSYGLANSAYCTGGAKKMINMLNKNLDMNISDFVTVNFQAVAETVELLGGIDVEMKKEEVVHLNNYCVETSEVTGMDYTPLEEIEGVQHLNGVQAVAYARIRKTSGNDFRRAARQREVIYKIVEKAKNSSIATLNTVLDKIFPMIYTSLTEKEILSMGMNMLSYDIEDQTGFPFDHLYGDTVKEAMDGVDCVLPITLESNVIKLHEFLYPEDSYVPSNEVKTYSQEISDKSGFGEESRLEHSEDGSLAAYRETDTESADTTENTADTQEESTADTTGDTQGYDESSLAQ
ncbi:LCP family protein [Blautia sp.]|uniref:LCP family protein n=1 Tax=Blautia sp. TaxID=1955243 RepID=UPI00257F2001|nr:LCP family protein [Blautia sp.]